MNIHPSSYISPYAEVGEGTTFGPFCYVGDKVKIGDNNTFAAHTVIGMPAEYRNTDSEFGVIIGNNNTFREFFTVNCGVNGHTRIGNNGYFMTSSHVAHDCVIEDDVTLANNVALGGSVYVMRGANLGLNVSVHQGQKIGAYSMLGMGAVVTKKSQIEPGGVYVGVPAKYLRLNHIGLERAGQRDLTDYHNQWEAL